jgi:hypothetical protein
VKLRKASKEYRAVDKRKSAKTLAALVSVSNKVAKKNFSAKALPREAQQKSVTKVSLKLNVSGNNRGMHNHLAPPDSEHMRKIRGMRRFYGKQMPVLQCNTCSFSSACPQFKAGYQCAFLPFLNAHKVESAKDLITGMQELAGAGMRRAHLMTLFETLSGAKPSLETTEALGLCFQQMKSLHETITSGGDGELSLETDDAGIIGRLFGSVSSLLDTTREAQQNPIDVLPVARVTQVVDLPAEAYVTDQPTQVNADLVREHQKSELTPSSSRLITPEVSVSALNK